MSNNKDNTNNIDREDIMRAFFSQKKLSSQKILAENKVSGISADNRDEHFGIASGGNRKLGGRRFGMK
jgi:hypothetical protein